MGLHVDHREAPGLRGRRHRPRPGPSRQQPNMYRPPRPMRETFPGHWWPTPTRKTAASPADDSRKLPPDVPWLLRGRSSRRASHRLGQQPSTAPAGNHVRARPRLKGRPGSSRGVSPRIIESQVAGRHAPVSASRSEVRRTASRSGGRLRAGRAAGVGDRRLKPSGAEHALRRPGCWPRRGRRQPPGGVIPPSPRRGVLGGFGERHRQDSAIFGPSWRCTSGTEPGFTVITSTVRRGRARGRPPMPGWPG